MARLPDDWKATLRASGGDRLSARAMGRVSARIARHGYDAATHNFGRILCRLPHAHDDDRCASIGGVQVRRWASDEEGMRRLVLLAAHDPSVELGGFTSTYPEGGGTRAHDGSDAGGIFDNFIPRSVTPEQASSIAHDELHPFGPTEAAELAFQRLTLSWAAYEKAGVPADWPALRPTYDAWIAFRDGWTGGEPDTTALSAMAADADRVRRTLAEKDPAWGDPDKGETAQYGVPDVTQSTGLLRAAQGISEWAKGIPGLPGSAPIPWYYKAGAAVAGVLLVMGAVRR